MAFSIKTLSIVDLIVTLSIKDIQLSDIQHKHRNAECHYAESRIF